MKKLLIGLVAAILLIVAAAIVVPLFVPLDTYKGKIVALVKQATGRDLRIDGPLHLSLLPSIALEADDVAFANPPGSSSPDMAQLKTLDIRLKLLPLLHGAIEVDRLRLVEPAIALEIDKDGRPNWVFATPPPPPQSTPAAPVAPPASGGIPAISFEDVTIVNGQASYLDQRNGEKRLLGDINMQFSLPNFAGPFDAKGQATWNGQPVTLTLTVGLPVALQSGGSSPVTLALAAAPIKFDFQGDATGATLAQLTGAADLAVPSVRGLAQWLGIAFTPPGTGFGPLTIKGKIAMAGPKIAFTDAAITLDGINATGAVTLDTSGARPDFSGRLDLDKLDINPYLSAAGKAAAGGSATSAPAASNSAGWSDAPIELAALNAADADFDLTANSILYRKIAVGKSALGLHVKSGRLEADLTEMALYQGTGEGKVTVDGSAPTPSFAASFDLSGVAVEPLLRDAAGFDRLSGTGKVTIDTTSHGTSQREIVGTLAGKGSIDLTNGKITGVNLVAFMKNLTSAVTSGGKSADDTDFSALTATYTIANGILHNDDLKLAAPDLPMTGAGTVDLPQRQVDYKVTPSVAGIVAVPVAIVGPWDNLSYRPELGDAAKGLLKQPGKALDLLKNQGSGAAGLLKGLLGK